MDQTLPIEPALAVDANADAQKQYEEAMKKYKADLANYEKVKAQYDKDLANYEKEIAEMNANKAKDGWLKEAIGQSLIYNKRQPNARVLTDKSPSARGTIDDVYPGTGYPNVIGSNMAFKYKVNVGDSVTATYTELDGVTYKGQPVSKIVYKFTPKKAPLGYLDLILTRDPTETAILEDQDGIQQFLKKLKEQLGNGRLELAQSK